MKNLIKSMIAGFKKPDLETICSQDLIEYTPEQLENNLYSLDNLFVGSLVQSADAEEDQVNIEPLMLKYCYNGWYLDIESGKYYKDYYCKNNTDINKAYVDSKESFKHLCYETLDYKGIPDCVRLTAKQIREVYDQHCKRMKIFENN